MRNENRQGAHSPAISSHLDSVFNAMVDGIILIDQRGTIQSVNPASCSIFGFSEEEMIGKNVSMLMPAPHSVQHDGYINTYRNTGVKKIIGIGREVEGRKKNGTLFPFRLSISEFKIEDEVYFTGIVHDITEIKKAQHDLELVNKQLEKIVSERTNDLTSTVNKLLHSNSLLKAEISLREKTEQDLEKALIKEKELGILKSNFVTMASHEFRTPLSTILSSASIIGRYIQASDQIKREKHVDKIKSAVKNMTAILEDILSLGKLEEGKIDNQPTSFELLEFAKSVVDKVNTILKEGQHIDLVTKNRKIKVNWSRHLTENIFNNLLSNAVKYSGDHTAVTLEIQKEGKEVLIRITDEGIGIPATQQKHLFDRFFRATNVMNIKGTGLGLHIVQQYVNLMSGNIEFSSKEGKGSVFSVRIPVSYSK